MGAAGAGKSVQGSLLAEKIGYQWLSTGQYLRDNITDEIQEVLKQGKLVADDQVIEILVDFFESIPDQSKTILDGFPRTIKQAKWLIEQNKEGKILISGVVYLEISKEIAIERLLKRGREDDTEKILEQRFNDYQNLTLPVIDWLEKQSVNVIKVNADQEIDKIQKSIINALNLKV